MLIKSTMESTVYEMSEELDSMVKDLKRYITDTDMITEHFISGVMNYIDLIRELSEMRGKKILILDMAGGIQNLQQKAMETQIKMAEDYMENNKATLEIANQTNEMNKKMIDVNEQISIQLSHIAKSLADISRNKCMNHRD